MTRKLVLPVVLITTLLLLFGVWQFRSATPKVVAAPNTCSGYVALTFDDGPSSSTPELLAVLKKWNTHAVFFNLGSKAQQYGSYVQAEVAAKHQVGSHSWDHPDLRTLTPEQVSSQLTRTHAVLQPLAEVEFFRPPYGSSTPAIEKKASQLGMATALWTVDSKDWKATSVEQIVEQSKGMLSGGNLLLHDGNVMTIKAVPLIINYYHLKGFCFGKLATSKKAYAPVESPDLLFYAEAVKP